MKTTAALGSAPTDRAPASRLTPPVAQRAAALARAREAPRCYARTRAGTLCQAPACVGRQRCRLHGGRALKGEAHPGYVHGGATRAGRRERARLAALVRACRRTLTELGRRHTPGAGAAGAGPSGPR